MASNSKPEAKDGLATGVQTVAGVPVLMKEAIPAGDLDAREEKEPVLAAFHSTDKSASGMQTVGLTKEVANLEKPDDSAVGAKEKETILAPKPVEEQGKSEQSLATGMQSLSGVPILTKEVASLEKPDDSAFGAKEKERVLAAFHSPEEPVEEQKNVHSLATGVQTVGGVPIVTKEVAGLGDPAVSTDGAKERERVLGASHSEEPTGSQNKDGEPSPKPTKKGTISALKERVSLAFAKPEKGDADEKEHQEKAGATLKDRVYQIGEKVKSQASSLRSSWSKTGAEEKDIDPVAEENLAGAESRDKPKVATPAETSLEGDKASVKERMMQIGEKVMLQATSLRTAWKPEERKDVGEDAGAREHANESNLRHEYGKGRVTVFSISGCPHCKAAKALLKKKKVKFSEVNLDVFPERREEMQERTGKSSCPQIFFNDKLIGGNDSLQALENEGKLDAELQLVCDTAVPSTAPATAGPSKVTFAPAGQKPDEHLDFVKLLREKLVLKDRWYKLRKYDRCFVGSEAVDLLVGEKQLSRLEAITLLQQLQAKHFFHHVLREHPFKDGPFYYRFLEHEPFLKAAANWSGATSDSEPPSAVNLGTTLRKMILAIYDEFLSEDGRHVDYQGIAESEIFTRYIKKTLELQRIDVASLCREEKLAFFINVYNALVIHVTAVLGHGPTTLAVRRHFFTEHTYIIGGSSYSLMAIENGILRGNKRPPFFFSKPFGDKDDRLLVALSTPEPLIHFALVCGAKSCPPVKTYEPKTIDESLKAAAQGFFEGGGIKVDAEAKVIHLSKILSWYKSDFGSTDLEMLKFVAQFLTPKDRDKLEGLMSEGKYKIEFQPYDWSANSAE